MSEPENAIAVAAAGTGRGPDFGQVDRRLRTAMLAVANSHQVDRIIELITEDVEYGDDALGR